MQDILTRYGIDENALIGAGSEANVYALDDDRVLRVHHARTPAIVVVRRREILDELQEQQGKCTFRLPHVLEVAQEQDRIVSIEARLPGLNMLEVLGAEVPDRKQLLRSYLSAARQVGDLKLARDWYGDLVRDESIRTMTFSEYALARIHDSLRTAGDTFRAVNAIAISDALGESPKALVHMDFYPGNVLVEDNAVSAVLDFGPASIIGDRRLDPVSAAVYLDVEITPTATDADRDYAMTWLEANELDEMYEPVKRWLAAFWCDAKDDVALHAWCAQVLGVTLPAAD